MTPQTNTLDSLIEQIMQSGFEVAMGGHFDKSEEWNRRWQEKSLKIAVKTAHTQIKNYCQEQVIAVLQEIVDWDVPATYEQDGKTWQGLAIPRNLVRKRLGELQERKRRESPITKEQDE